MSGKNFDEFAEMSDEDFMSATFGAGSPPLPEDATSERVDQDLLDPPEPASGGAGTAEQVQPAAAVTDADADDADDASHHTTPQQTEAPASQAPAAAPVTPEAKPAEALGSKTDETPAPEVKTESNYEELYNKVMAPFKANGRDFKPESPEEAIRLMQLGANYTKKMHKLAPNLKIVRMLENNGLLDENKVNFLIDLNKKEPGAIHRLLSEAKIDPLEIDPNEPVKYTPGNYQVSDNEMAFQDTISSVTETPTGKDTIHHVNDTWDLQSKQMLFKDPQILEVINEQRANGIYARISAEVERQRTLGNLTNVPFIQAYHQVGGQLHQAGLLGNKPVPTPAVTPTPAAVLETRADPVRKQMTNGDKARAASPAPKTAQAAPKTLAPDAAFTMSDEEILALTQRRF